MTTLVCPPILRCPEKDGVAKRRRSVNLPLNYLIAAMSNTSNLQPDQKKKRRVRFPSSVLMQQAVTDGDLQEIKQLIGERGVAAVNEREPSGLPPVMRAVFEGQLQSLRLLVEAGADLSARDQEGWNALHVASIMDDCKAAELVLKASKEDLTRVYSVEGERPIDLAESPEMARTLLRAYLEESRSSLSTGGVTEEGDADELSLVRLVEEHYEEHGDCEQLTVLLKSHTSYESLLHLAAAKNYAVLAHCLLGKNLSDKEASDRHGWSPLHTAAYSNSLEAVLLLVDSGASVHKLTNSYQKPSDLTQVERILMVLLEKETSVYS